MSKQKEIIQKDEVIQAVLIADNFNDEFAPITNDIPLALLPLVNRPLLEYSLESLALGGIQETFLFSSLYPDAIKEYIRNGIANKVIWSQTMQVNIIVSESCRSLGDCLRDLDAKGVIRGSFVLAEPGAIANIKLDSIIKKHNDIAKKDKSAAMTLILEETGMGQFGRCSKEEILIASNADNRVLFLNKLGLMDNKKIDFPLDIFLENSVIAIHHDLRDTHMAICSPTVLPLFSDNFDYQTRDDFVKGLLIIDEVLDSTIYCHTIKGNQHGSAVTNWRMYQAMSKELIENWMYPIAPTAKSSKSIISGKKCKIPQDAKLINVIIGDNVTIGNNVKIENSFILSNTNIQDNCIINGSIIGSNVLIRKDSRISTGCVIGANVILNNQTKIENILVQSSKPDFSEDSDKLGEKAYKLQFEEDDELVELNNTYSRFKIYDEIDNSEYEDYESSVSEDEMSYTNSPIPDDTNMFFTEVTDSLARGIEDKLQCDNLILEINSSRYAYNVTLKEVNYNVIKAILNLPFQHSSGQQYLQALSRCLQYFSPIIKNYIHGYDAMEDCLLAITDVASSNNELNECVSKILNWFYDKDFITEEAIMDWYKKLDTSTRLWTRIGPYINWLQEAEEASSSDEDSD